MFCPQCGTNPGDELKFCNACGANLFAVRQVVASRETGEKFDWSKTWVTDMLLSDAERNRRRGIDPEAARRASELKGGIITACVGLGLSIFLFVMGRGVILGGNVPPEAVEIVSRIWVAGAIPLLIGAGLVLNGLLVTGRVAKSAGPGAPRDTGALEEGRARHALPSPDAGELAPPDFGVTEGTTRHLQGSRSCQR